jgi:protein-disulfide isomerase
MAAIAGNCVREQKGNDAYFEYHDIVFEEQAKQGQNTIQFTEEDVFSWVDKIDGIDKDKFDTCYNDPAQKAEVDADLAAGAAAGVSGTPSFFINGKNLVGAQPYNVIKAEIERALNE